MLTPIRFTPPVKSHPTPMKWGPIKFGRQQVYNYPTTPLYVSVTNSPDGQLQDLNQKVQQLTSMLDKRLGDILQILTPVNPPHKDM